METVSRSQRDRREPYLPFVISWNLTRRCDLACAHCYLDASGLGAERGELSTLQALQVLEQLAEVNPQAMLVLTGGEPLLRRDLEAIAAEASRLGFLTVLGSHGGLLDAASLERLMAAGLRGAGVSIDSADRREHDRFRGAPGAWDRAMRAMKAMRDGGLPFLVEATLTRANADGLGAIAELAAREGAVALNVFFLIRVGRGATLDDLGPQDYDIALMRVAELRERYDGILSVNAKCAPSFQRILRKRNSRSNCAPPFPDGGCPAGTYYCRITPEGDLTPCPYLPLPLGNLLRTPFDILWKESPVLAELRQKKLSGRCGRCEFAGVCGGCRCRAWLATGDYLAEDPSCAYQPPGGGEAAAARVDGHEAGPELAWTREASEGIAKVPSFARAMVRRAVESAARKRGLGEVDGRLWAELRAAVAARFPRARRPA